MPFYLGSLSICRAFSFPRYLYHQYDFKWDVCNRNLLVERTHAKKDWFSVHDFVFFGRSRTEYQRVIHNIAYYGPSSLEAWTILRKYQRRSKSWDRVTAKIRRKKIRFIVVMVVVSHQSPGKRKKLYHIIQSVVLMAMYAFRLLCISCIVM